MVRFLESIQALVKNNEILLSYHGYEELENDSIRLKDVISGIKEAIPVELYPEYGKGPCILVLQKDRDGNPIHVVWGIPAGKISPAVLVTAYRPSRDMWDDDFTRRKQ